MPSSFQAACLFSLAVEAGVREHPSHGSLIPGLALCSLLIIQAVALGALEGKQWSCDLVGPGVGDRQGVS